jgi:O-antigen/teichoic acid export membrane protein
LTISQKLFSQSAVIFAARMCGAGIMFLVQAVIARKFGQAEFGGFLIVLAATNIIAMLMPLGFQTIGSYFIAEYAAKSQRDSLKKFVQQGVLQIVLVSIVFIVVTPVLSFSDNAAVMMVRQHWLSIICMAFASALVFISGSTLTALKQPFVGLAAETLFRPMIIALSLAIILAWQTDHDLRWLLIIMAVGYLVIALGHGVIAAKAIARVGTELSHPPAEHRRWWRFAFPWVLISLATDFYFDLDLLHLSHLLNPQDLAVFGVAIRIFTLAAFGVTAVYTIVMPHVFEAEASGNRTLFLKRIGDANLVALGMSAGLVVVLAIAGPFALAIFGADFMRGSTSLVILSFSLVVRSFFGPASLILSLHDRPYAPLPAAACGLALLFSFNLYAVPAYGILGASVAALAAITIWSVLLWITARRITGTDVSMLPRLRSLVGL